MNPLLIFAAASLSIVAVVRTLSPRHQKGASSMYDTNKEISKYHNDKVRLPQTTQDKLRGHRQANQNRLKNGLKSANKALPKEFIKQGSYAMYTINQHQNNDYDIDDGAAFEKDDLVGDRGAEMSGLQARQMVRDAVDDGSFKQAPEVRANCVRVYYQEGHHVDIPVYRKCTDFWGEEYLELASSSWKKSDPKGVTNWFNDSVKDKSPDSNNGQQMRRTTRLMKKYSTSRDSWNSPSGFIISVLVDECYSGKLDRDDEALYETMRKIYNRLCIDLTVRHPVLNEYLTKSSEDACMVDFKDHLKKALDDLQVLFDDDCTHKSAMAAWKKVFNDKFFDEQTASENNALAGLAIASSTPSAPVQKQGGGRFG